MSQELDDADRPSDDVLAGEYALGVLSGEERRVVEARLRTDAAFAALAEGWRMRLAGLAADVAPVEPAAATWSAIERTLFAGQPDAAKPLTLWESLGFWRALSAAFLGVAAGSLAFALFVARPGEPRQLVASLQATDAGPSYLARLDPDSGLLLVRAVQADGDASRVPELWLIPGDGVPRSLGVIGREGASEVVVPDRFQPLLGSGAVLAISLEPPGGSATGKPTGPVIAAGKVGEL